MTTYDIMAADGGSKLRVTIRDSATKALINLDGKTVQLRYSLNGGTTVLKTMTPLDQATKTGQADYQFDASDLTVGGELIGEVRLQAGLSDQLTTVNRFHLRVGSALP